ncbi:MFS transporter [Silvibacterium acidisoli]|uniref:MFS transporter n=1 Tax=Acidobacteriaceae bacterium ZG23-2 TaxID=2883246 RepID=UPI00406CB97B
MNKPRFESLPASRYYTGLVFSGIATVLSGPLLPALSARLSLTDAQSGAIFTAQFAAATVGSALSSHFRRRAVPLGYLSIAFGMAALSFSSYAAVLAGFALIGLGVGCAITATNLIFGNAYPEQRASLLAWVNVYWGIGAIACPQLVAVAEHLHGTRAFTAALSLALLLVVALLAPLLRAAPAAQKETPAHSGPITPAIFIVFSLTVALYIGIETSLAGWVATYAHRFAALTPAQSSLLVSVFWLSILLGRLALPRALNRISEMNAVFLAFSSLILGIGLLLAPQVVVHDVPATILCGLGCAPIYPITVGRLLARIGQSRHAGWIFALCGCGGAVLPWSMGFVSTRFHSLRAAFAVPVAGAVAILLLVLVERKMPAVEAPSR